MSLHHVYTPIGKPRDELEECKIGDYVLGGRHNEQEDQFSIIAPERGFTRWIFNHVALVGDGAVTRHGWQRVT